MLFVGLWNFLEIGVKMWMKGEVGHQRGSLSSKGARLRQFTCLLSQALCLEAMARLLESQGNEIYINSTKMFIDLRWNYSGIYIYCKGPEFIWDIFSIAIFIRKCKGTKDKHFPFV
jgi:hypothetical protein